VSILLVPFRAGSRRATPTGLRPSRCCTMQGWSGRRGNRSRGHSTAMGSGPALFALEHRSNPLSPHHLTPSCRAHDTYRTGWYGAKIHSLPGGADFRRQHCPTIYGPGSRHFIHLTPGPRYLFCGDNYLILCGHDATPPARPGRPVRRPKYRSRHRSPRGGLKAEHMGGRVAAMVAALGSEE
jgi:hypothetical protein